MYSRFHDIFPESFKKLEKFPFLFSMNLEVIKGIGSVSKAGLPFGGGNVKSTVGRFHVAAKVLAWPSGQLAHLADEQLTSSLSGVKASATSKPGEHGV